MNRSELVKILGRIKYKPGVKFVANGDNGDLIRPVDWLGHMHVGIQTRVRNRDDHKESLPIEFFFLVYTDMDERTVVEVARSAIIKMEMHEVDEFFTYDGMRLYDPHDRSTEGMHKIRAKFWEGRNDQGRTSSSGEGARLHSRGVPETSDSNQFTNDGGRP